MKQASNILALTITGIAVKTYMLVSITWSKSSEQYKRLQSEARQLIASKPAHPAQATA